MTRLHALFANIAAVAAILFIVGAGGAKAQQKEDFAYFDGTNSLTFPDHHSLDLGMTGIVEFWVAAMWDQADKAPVAVSYVGIYGPRYAFAIMPDKKGLVFYSNEDFSVVKADFSDGLRHHVAAFTYGKLTDAYVDGKFVGTFPLGYGSYGSMLCFGSLDGEHRFFTGYVGMVRIWDRVVPVETILERRDVDYINTKGALKSNPVGNVLVGLSNFAGGVAGSDDKFILMRLSDKEMKGGLQYGTSPGAAIKFGAGAK